MASTTESRLCKQFQNFPDDERKIEKVTCDEDLKHLSPQSGELVLVTFGYLMELYMSKNATVSDDYMECWSEKEENDYDNNYSFEKVKVDIENGMNSKKITDIMESMMADKKDYSGK